mmetsp:Transcript_23775/g.58281  ORF Transcript_23775/g.58281 Transcript_23775/m.58281 type:complete len:229 (+) Transcript_23775:203-889(+)
MCQRPVHRHEGAELGAQGLLDRGQFKGPRLAVRVVVPQVHRVVCFALDLEPGLHGGDDDLELGDGHPILACRPGPKVREAHGDPYAAVAARPLRCRRRPLARWRLAHEHLHGHLHVPLLRRDGRGVLVRGEDGLLVLAPHPSLPVHGVDDAPVAGRAARHELVPRHLVERRPQQVVCPHPLLHHHPPLAVHIHQLPSVVLLVGETRASRPTRAPSMDPPQNPSSEGTS